MGRPKGSIKTPGSGRQKGSENVSTREFKDLMHGLLFDDVETSRRKLLELRDSEEATDRKTYWGLAAKLLPQKVEGKFETDIPLLVLDQNYVAGTTREVEEVDDGE